MKIITLSIKQKNFDDIVSGVKKKEYREVAPTTDKKYLIIDSEGYCKQNKKGDIIPRKYDAIRFYTGQMKGKRESALVQIKSAKCEIMVDENEQPITYMFDDYEHTACRVVFSLGKILEI